MLRRTPIQRSPIHRKHRWYPKPTPREDPVTAEMAAATFKRDGYSCVAPRLGGTSMDCWGKNRIEHVKVEARMGKRGELLVTLCEGHTEPGMKAGYIWCTDAANRREMRRYALSFDA